jgi:pyruvate dehydrogenase E1 component
VATATSHIEEPAGPLSQEELEGLLEIEQRMRWLATMMVHHANAIRPNPDGSKVGGHQASSASVATILTALYFHFLRAGDRVSIKPHASPAYHAAQYLLGNLDRTYLTTLREFKGLQAYPSRTKDPDPVDFSTGSVGLGAVAPVYAALASAYCERHFGAVNSRRFIAVIGDAELDEGNVWETVAEEAIRGLGNVIWVVDLNRQSLDRVIPGVRAARLKALFSGAGWRVFEAKYGSRLTEAMDGAHGDALRRRIDEMSNEEYQSLIRVQDGVEIRKRLTAVTGSPYRKALSASVEHIPDAELRDVIANLGGHDLPRLVDILNQADAVQDAPAVVFAYTIKGFGLPIAGDPLNHSQLLTQAQIDQLREQLNVPADDPWALIPGISPGGQLIERARVRLHGEPVEPQMLDGQAIPNALDTRHPGATSTQEALGRALTRLADVKAVRERVVTMSPDVATSTHLSAWINKTGVFALEPEADFEPGGPRMLKWQPNPGGQHIELGISEMNLFMALGQFGLSYELTGQHLIPIGTVYDPFVCRGLDALIYSLYTGAKMIFAGTPAGVSLSPEGGAHQSAITPSIGLELPEVVFYEPTFGVEVEWILLEGLRQCCDRARGRSTYLRLSTKPIDQRLLNEPLERFGKDELRRQVLAGGYRLVDRAKDGRANAMEPVTIFVGGIMAPEAVEASARLLDEGIAATVVNATSIDRIYDDLRNARRQQLRNASGTANFGHIETLVPPSDRRTPIVSILDGASHAMAFLGSVFGVPVVPLGVDEFGQSGSRDALYRQTGIGVDEIVNAAMLAIELME